MFRLLQGHHQAYFGTIPLAKHWRLKCICAAFQDFDSYVLILIDAFSLTRSKLDIRHPDVFIVF